MLNSDERLRIYDSLDDLALHMRQVLPYMDNGDDRVSHYGMPYNEAIEQLSQDYTRNREAINKIIEEMEVADVFTTGLPMPERHYWGTRPNVAAAIAGLPKNMMRRVPSENTSIATPINIYIDAIVSCGVSQSIIQKRGIAVCALVMALKTFRPVSVYMIFALKSPRGKTNCVKVQIAENTLDVGRMDFCFSDNTYCRRLMFAEHQDMDGFTGNGSIKWGWNEQPTGSTYQNNCRRVFGITQDDLYITGGFLNDKRFMNNPVQWVKNMVEKYKHLEAAE